MKKEYPIVMFKGVEIHDGFEVVLKNGIHYQVARGFNAEGIWTLILISNNKVYFVLKDFLDEYEDIIYEINGHAMVSSGCENNGVPTFRNVLWTMDGYEEMTVQQIEKELGRKIKIIGERV